MNQWHHTSKTPRFYALDARIIVIFFIFILHISWTTFYISIGLMVPLIIAEYMGLTIPIILRRGRSILAGKHRPARKKRRYVNPP